MKLYKFWATHKQKISIHGETVEVRCYGGSNLSPEDAAQNAAQKMGLIERKINGEHGVFEDYEVEIREEILEEIHSNAVITRNRYGARVLNVSNLLILDIDKPKTSFIGLFSKKDPQQDKAKIFEMVRKLASSSKYSGLGFRVYETFQGARVIVSGRDFDPRDSDTTKLMNEFNCDSLYTTLCVKQDCFRARLTPKPSRIKMRKQKVNFPRETDPQVEQWIEAYEKESHNFSVCKFIEQIGANATGSDLIRLHDELTKAHTNLRLA
ncbi:MAG: hypothetical protein IPL71_05540 [Anaerolineales bacterium]|uniref:hypothetical protein n=1 Tax=Candidatus Villigracilis proximus TaxID=3140683 RepID=UPI0031356F5D|nr:hypothetical protein [Anaerolineales bacterium]